MTINAKTAAILLQQWGHFLPRDPDGARIAQDVQSHHDPRLLAAVSSYQRWYKVDLDPRCLRIHGRLSVHDGQVGPATSELLNARTCSVPDPIGADYEYKPLEANWPTACRENLTFSRLFGSINGLDPLQTTEAFRRACAMWAEKLFVQIFQDNTLGKDAHIWAGAGALSGNVLAWSYLAQNSCAAHLEQRYNTRVTWDGSYLATVACHELGHALGLGHLNDPRALMYPSARRDVNAPHELDVMAAVRLGYARRTGDPPPPDPPAPDPTPDVKIGGTIGGRRYKLVCVDDDDDDDDNDNPWR